MPTVKQLIERRQQLEAQLDVYERLSRLLTSWTQGEEDQDVAEVNAQIERFCVRPLQDELNEIDEMEV